MYGSTSSATDSINSSNVVWLHQHRGFSTILSIDCRIRLHNVSLNFSKEPLWHAIRETLSPKLYESILEPYELRCSVDDALSTIDSPPPHDTIQTIVWEIAFRSKYHAPNWDKNMIWFPNYPKIEGIRLVQEISEILSVKLKNQIHNFNFQIHYWSLM